MRTVITASFVLSGIRAGGRADVLWARSKFISALRAGKDSRFASGGRMSRCADLVRTAAAPESIAGRDTYCSGWHEAPALHDVEWHMVRLRRSLSTRWRLRYRAWA